MAGDSENRSHEDLTEEASPYRLEEYRRKGQVSQSKEVSSVITLLALGSVLLYYSPKMGVQLQEFMKEVLRTDLTSRSDLGSLNLIETFLHKALMVFLQLAFPICGAGFVLGALASFLQVGPIFSWDPVTPDFNKIDPNQGIRRIVSLRTLGEAGKLLLKVSITAVVAYSLVKTEILFSPSRYGQGLDTLASSYILIGKKIFLSLVAVFGVFAVLDFFVQRRSFQKNLRMTKQEAKQEHREREGDPQVKARIRAVQREVARKRLMQATRKADVIITNPTHIAIAIQYDKDKMNAPKVVAKGADLIAQKMKAVAAEAGVPTVENIPLARALYKSVKMGHAIPRNLYQAVAEVLAFVYKLKRRNL